jgi:hypothetical protein
MNIHEYERKEKEQLTVRPAVDAAKFVDRSAESEFTIQPDGRVHLFGITRPALEVLACIPNQDVGMRERLKRLLDTASGAGASRADEPQEDTR